MVNISLKLMGQNAVNVTFASLLCLEIINSKYSQPSLYRYSIKTATLAIKTI